MIERVWKHSKAENAEGLVGKQVTIRVSPHVYGKKAGYLGRVRQFLALLKLGDTDSFDVRHSDGDSLTFLELTKGQIERVEGAGK